MNSRDSVAADACEISQPTGQGISELEMQGESLPQIDLWDRTERSWLSLWR